MSLRNGLLMALLLIVGGLYVWRSEGPSIPATAPKSDLILSAFDERTATEVGINSKGSEFKLRRADEETAERARRELLRASNVVWVIDGETNEPANSDATTRMFAVLSQLTAANTLTNEEAGNDLNVYGLGAPELTVSAR